MHQAQTALYAPVNFNYYVTAPIQALRNPVPPPPPIVPPITDDTSYHSADDAAFFFAVDQVELTMDDLPVDDFPGLDMLWNRQNAAFDREGISSSAITEPGACSPELTALQMAIDNIYRVARHRLYRQHLGPAAAKEFWRSPECWWQRYERGRLAAIALWPDGGGPH